MTTTPEPVTYQVRETRPQVSQSHPPQVVRVGHSPAGVHLIVTPQAAAQLAHFLIGTTVQDPERLRAHLEAGVDDTDLWAHVAVDVLQARARHLHRGDAQPAHVATEPGQSGYLRPVRTATPGDHQ